MKPSSITHYRIGEVAKMLKKHQVTLRRYVKNGQLLAERDEYGYLWFSKPYINALVQEQ